MECLSLLRISARLVDLHDAEWLPGNSPIFVQEERRGLRDGRYLDLAGFVLDALRVNAHRSGNASKGFDAMLIAVKDRRSDVDPDDLRYVLNVLSLPTEFWSIDHQSGEGMRIGLGLALRTRFPQLELSALYRPMCDMVDQLDCSHPYAAVFGKANQAIWRDVEDVMFNALAAKCAWRAVDQEAVDLLLCGYLARERLAL